MLVLQPARLISIQVAKARILRFPTRRPTGCCATCFGQAVKDGEIFKPAADQGGQPTKYTHGKA